MTKADPPKPSTKLETITLKVFIHCEGCRRKVRRIIRVVDGVEDVTVDAASSKVIITGTADVKAILQRLQKYGKHAEMWPNLNPTPPAAGKATPNPPKPSNNNNSSDSSNKKKGNVAAEGADKAGAATEKGSKKGDGKDATPAAPAKNENAVKEGKPEKSKEAVPEVASGADVPTPNGGGGGGGGGGKKGGKKGGNPNNSESNSNNGGSHGNAPETFMPPPLPVHDIPIMSAPNTSIAVSASKSRSPYDSIQTEYTSHSAEYATHMFSDENANNCRIM